MQFKHPSNRLNIWVIGTYGGVSKQPVLSYERDLYLSNSVVNTDIIENDSNYKREWFEGHLCVPGGKDMVQGIIIQAEYSQNDNFVIDRIDVQEGCSIQEDVKNRGNVYGKQFLIEDNKKRKTS